MKKARLLFLVGAVASFLALFASGAAAGKGSLGCRVELERGVLLAGERQRAIMKVTLDAPMPPERAERPPVNLAIVLDRSGSMSGAKLEKAKEAAIVALRLLGPQDTFSVVIYDHIVETLVPAQRAVNTEWIEARIRSIRSRGNTALFGGVSQGAAEVRKNFRDGYVHRIILLSDGLANVGPRTPDDLGRLGAALLKENISVTTVGVGTDYNEDLMTRLAQNSDGNTYFVESYRDLPRIFAAELGDLLSVVAKNIVLRIQFQNGVRPISTIGRDGRIAGRTVELYLNQLYGGQEKYALIEVEVPGFSHNVVKRIATAKVSYFDAINQKTRTGKTTADARFSERKLEVQSSANRDVQRAYLLNMNALYQDRAVELADQGKREEAVSTLKKSIGMLKDAGDRYEDQVLLDKAREMEGRAAGIEAKGMTKSFRKTLRTDSLQERHQQMSK